MAGGGAPSSTAAVEADDFSRATYRNVALPRWNDGPILFIGDAAHGTSPQLGQGANLGLVDAWTLADALAESADSPSAIARFAERRSATVRFYRQASHLLTPFFQSRLTPLGWLRDAFMGSGVPAAGLAADRCDDAGRHAHAAGCRRRRSTPRAATAAAAPSALAQRPGVRPKRAEK